MTMLIDHRTGSGKFVDHPALEDIAVSCEMDCGDFLFNGQGREGEVSIGIELKSIDDLLSSLKCGRLQGCGGQLQRMIEQYDVCWLLYYGDHRVSYTKGSQSLSRISDERPWEPTGRPYAYLESFLMGVQDVGVRVSRVFDKHSAGYWLRSCYNRYQKPWAEQLETFNVINEEPMSTSTAFSLLGQLKVNKLTNGQRLRMKMASCLGGIRHTLAVRTALHFNTTRGMINASVKAWSEIDGIGTVTAKTIVNQIEEE